MVKINDELKFGNKNYTVESIKSDKILLKNNNVYNWISKQDIKNSLQTITFSQPTTLTESFNKLNVSVKDSLTFENKYVQIIAKDIINEGFTNEIFYHGSHNGKIKEFNTPEIYWSTSNDFSKSYGIWIYKAKLNLGKCFDITNARHFNMLKQADGEICYMNDDGELIPIPSAKDLRNSLMVYDNWEITEHHLDFIKQHFNSARITEGGTINYIVFNNNQVKLIGEPEYRDLDESYLKESVIQDKYKDQVQINGQWYHKLVIDGQYGTGTFDDLEIGDDVDFLNDKITKAKNYPTTKKDFELNDNFKQWFRDSKIVDENGNPLVVYHGSYVDIKKFNTDYASSTTGNNNEKVFYFTSDKDTAIDYSIESTIRLKEPDFYDLEDTEKTWDDYVEEIREHAEKNIHIHPCFMRMENPFIYDYKGETFNTKKNYTILSILQGNWNNDNWGAEYWDEDIALEMMSYFEEYDEENDEYIVKDVVYDGAIFLNVIDNIGDIVKEINEYIVWNPNQIKSVYNKGIWSLYNDNIDESVDIINEQSFITVYDNDKQYTKKYNCCKEDAIKEFNNTFKYYNELTPSALLKNNFICEDKRNYGIFYHGTPYSFDEFDKIKQRGGFLGRGIYFTLNKSMAISYGHNIISAKLDYNNSFFFNYDVLPTKIVKEMLDTSKMDDSKKEKILQTYEELTSNNGIYEANYRLFDLVDFYNGDSTSILQKYGYDSIDNIDRDSEFVIFEPQQVHVISKNNLRENIEDEIYIGYHGTNADFDEFDSKYRRMSTFGQGFYFVNDENEANEYGKFVIKAKLSMKNPLIIKDTFFGNEDVLEPLGIKKMAHLNSDDSLEKIKKAGYDSIIVLNAEGRRNLKYYIVFDNSQIEIISKSSKLNESFIIDYVSEKPIIYYTHSESEAKEMINTLLSKNPVRGLYDFVNKVYLFGDAYEVIHYDLIDKTNRYGNTKFNYPYDDKDIYQYLDKNCAMFKIIDENDYKSFSRSDGYKYAFIGKLDNNQYVICRNNELAPSHYNAPDELKKIQQVPLFQNIKFVNYDVRDRITKDTMPQKLVDESIHYAKQYKNQYGENTLFTIEKNPTKQEFWSLLKNSNSKELRGICGLEPYSNLYVWDAYFGTHQEVYNKYIKGHSNDIDKDFACLLFNAKDMSVFGFTKDADRIKQKYYGSDNNKPKDDKWLDKIIADDDLGLLNESYIDSDKAMTYNFKQGEPVKVLGYHGTSNSFSNFKNDMIFFSNYEEIAGGYGSKTPIKAVLTFKNPYIVDAYGQSFDKIYNAYGYKKYYKDLTEKDYKLLSKRYNMSIEEVKEWYPSTENGMVNLAPAYNQPAKSTNEWGKYAKSLGYDGVIIIDVNDTAEISNIRSIDYIVFNNSQIKILNSNNTLTESQSFWTDSGIVEPDYASQYNFKNFEPVTVLAYHMTPHTFNEFKIGQVNAWGKGVYLTTNPKECSFNPNVIDKWNCMELYATFFNPIIYYNNIDETVRNEISSYIVSRLSNDDIEKINENIKPYSNEKSSIDAYINSLFKNTMRTKYIDISTVTLLEKIKNFDKIYGLNVWKSLNIDGMILPFKNISNYDNDSKVIWYVCFKTNQIKSASNNNGNYDINSNNINEQKD